MTEKHVTVGLECGHEERPIAVLVQKASKYESSVYLKAGTKKINAKSIMGMMGMGMKNGDSVTVQTDGVDEAAAADEIAAHLETGK